MFIRTKLLIKFDRKHWITGEFVGLRMFLKFVRIWCLSKRYLAVSEFRCFHTHSKSERNRFPPFSSSSRFMHTRFIWVGLSARSSKNKRPLGRYSKELIAICLKTHLKCIAMPDVPLLFFSVNNSSIGRFFRTDRLDYWKGNVIWRSCFITC